jgi:hypothetical protein
MHVIVQPEDPGRHGHLSFRVHCGHLHQHRHLQHVPPGRHGLLKIVHTTKMIRPIATVDIS